MANEESILDLIGAIYDAALDERLWPETLEIMADHFDGTSAIIYASDSDNPSYTLVASTRLDPKNLEIYSKYYWGNDVWLTRSINLPTGSVFSSPMLLSDTAFRASEHYNDFLRPQKIFHLCSSVILNNNTQLGYISMFRPPDAEDFGPQEREHFQVIVPHLQRAVQVKRRMSHLDGRQRFLSEALDRIHVGTILVDSESRVIEMNPLAQGIIAKADGLLSTRVGLHAANSASTSRLHKLIGAASQTGSGMGLSSGGAVPLPRPSGKRPLLALVAPLGSRVPLGNFGLSGSAPAAIVFVSDPEDTPEIGTAVLSQLYDLTAAEARLAASIAAGTTVAEYADEAGVTVHTARSTLKQVMAKTDTRRQAELVRCLLTGLAAFGRRDEESE